MKLKGDVLKDSAEKLLVNTRTWTAYDGVIPPSDNVAEAARAELYRDLLENYLRVANSSYPKVLRQAFARKKKVSSSDPDHGFPEKRKRLWSHLRT